MVGSIPTLHIYNFLKTPLACDIVLAKEILAEITGRDFWERKFRGDRLNRHTPFCSWPFHLPFAWNGYCNCWLSSSHVGAMKTQKDGKLCAKDRSLHRNNIVEISCQPSTSHLYTSFKLLLFTFSVTLQYAQSLVKYSVFRLYYLEIKLKNKCLAWKHFLPKIVLVKF